VYAFPQLKLGVSDIAVGEYVSQYTNLPELDWKSASGKKAVVRAQISGSIAVQFFSGTSMTSPFRNQKAGAGLAVEQSKIHSRV
jgi:hypothetical protein